MRLRGQVAWFWIREGVQSWEFTTESRGPEVGGGARHAFEGAGSLVSDPREGQSWKFIIEGRGSEVGGGARHAFKGARSLVFGSKRGVRVGNSSQRIGLRRW